jgi:nicotinate-nucleotide pyrophosphorylase (carboxylating)
MCPLFDQDSTNAALTLVRMSLNEDLRDVGDVTCLATIPPDLQATVQIVSRESGIVSGLPLIPIVFRELSEDVSAKILVHDGDRINRGTVLASLTGSVRTLLTGERTVLNFMTHLSGIASRTAQFVEAIVNTKACILDTRKTLPGYRALQKYAVRCGGGTNHRMGLYDGVLIKDNHLAARGDSACASAVADARRYMIASRAEYTSIEIEVDTLEQLAGCAARKARNRTCSTTCRPSNFDRPLRCGIDTVPTTLLEASGGITLQTVRSVAETGVDRISIGGLTHSSPALDLGFDWPW